MQLLQVLGVEGFLFNLTHTKKMQSLDWATDKRDFGAQLTTYNYQRNGNHQPQIWTLSWKPIDELLCALVIVWEWQSQETVMAMLHLIYICGTGMGIKIYLYTQI